MNAAKFLPVIVSSFATVLREAIKQPRRTLSSLAAYPALLFFSAWVGNATHANAAPFVFALLSFSVMLNATGNLSKGLERNSWLLAATLGFAAFAVSLLLEFLWVWTDARGQAGPGSAKFDTVYAAIAGRAFLESAAFLAVSLSAAAFAGATKPVGPWMAALAAAKEMALAPVSFLVLCGGQAVLMVPVSVYLSTLGMVLPATILFCLPLGIACFSWSLDFSRRSGL